MSAKADKGDRKREIEQSPMNKKFRDSTISREDLEDAIASSIELALKEQQSTLSPNAVGFLRVNLSKWIPSLRGHDIEIDRAHRVYDGGRGSDRPRNLIFRVLRWHYRSEILKGARQAYPVKCAQNNVTLLFFSRL